MSQIYIVDDHPIVRKGLECLIDGENALKICGQTGSASKARRQIPEVNPDLAIVDPLFEAHSGFTLIEDLQTQTEELRILVFSALDEMFFAKRMLAAGADGYLMKSAGYRTVIKAIRRVQEGDLYLSEKMKESILSSYVKDSSASKISALNALSNRELEVFTLIGHGLDRQEIADTLSLSPKTVDVHRDRLKEKLFFDSATQLRQMAAIWVSMNELKIE